MMASPPSTLTPLLVSFAIVKLEEPVVGSFHARTLRNWHWRDFHSVPSSSAVERMREDEYTAHAELFCFPEVELVAKNVAGESATPTAGILIDVEPMSHDKITSRGRYAFVFALTDAQGRRTFGFCLRLKSMRQTSHVAPAWTLCILSHFGWRSLFFTLLNLFADRLLQPDASKPTAPEAGRYIDNLLGPGSEFDQQVSQLLRWIYSQPLPSQVRPLSLPISQSNAATLVDYSAPIDPAQHVMKQIVAQDLLLDPHFEGLFQCLGVTRLLLVFSSLLHERRVLITSSNLSLLTYSILALCSTLLPFCWQHIFIPVLPPSILAYCAAPIPFILGVHSSSYAAAMRHPVEEVLIINLDKRYDSPDEGERKAALRFSEIHKQDLRSLPDGLIRPLKNSLQSTLEISSTTIDNDAVSHAFRQFFVQAVGNYKDHFVPVKVSRLLADACENSALKLQFNFDSFIKSQPAAWRPFLELFGHSQLFERWLRQQEERLSAAQSQENVPVRASPMKPTALNTGVVDPSVMSEFDQQATRMAQSGPPSTGSVMDSVTGWASQLRQATEKAIAQSTAPKGGAGGAASNSSSSGGGGGGGFSFGRAASFLQATDKIINTLAQNTAQATRDVVSSIQSNPTAAEYLRPVTQSQVFKRATGEPAAGSSLSSSTGGTAATSTTAPSSRKSVTSSDGAVPTIATAPSASSAAAQSDVAPATPPVGSLLDLSDIPVVPAQPTFEPGPPVTFSQLHDSYGLELQRKTSGTVRPSAKIVDESLLDLSVLTSGPSAASEPAASDSTSALLLTCTPSLMSFESSSLASPLAPPSSAQPSDLLTSPMAVPTFAAHQSIDHRADSFMSPQHREQNQRARQQGNNDLLLDLS